MSHYCAETKPRQTHTCSFLILILLLASAVTCIHIWKLSSYLNRNLENANAAVHSYESYVEQGAVCSHYHISFCFSICCKINKLDLVVRFSQVALSTTPGAHTCWKVESRLKLFCVSWVIFRNTTLHKNIAGCAVIVGNGETRLPW